MTARGRLSPAALVLRAFHAAIAAGLLLAITNVWWCALTGRRGPLLRVALSALAGEGARRGYGRPGDGVVSTCP